jgi:hypothetical protein
MKRPSRHLFASRHDAKNGGGLSGVEIGRAAGNDDHVGLASHARLRRAAGDPDDLCGRHWTYDYGRAHLIIPHTLDDNDTRLARGLGWGQAEDFSSRCATISTRSTARVTRNTPCLSL